MLLSDLQTRVYDLLAAANALRLTGIEIYKVDRADAAARYAEGLAAAGTAVAVMPPEGRFERDSSEGPLSVPGGITVAVQISEPCDFSRAQGLPPVTDIAETVAWLLHSSNFPDRNDPVPLGVEDISLVPDEELLIYRVTLAATGSVTRPPSVLTSELS